MPAVGSGRENTTAQPKRKVKRKAAAPAAKKPTVVAPADRVSDRVEARRKQLKVSVKKAGDAPQNRAQDTARAEKFKRTDKYVQTVQDAAPKPTKILKVVKGQPVPDSKAEIRKVLAGGKRSTRVAAPAMNRMQTVTAAPALKVLEQTTRPLHAIAAGTDAAVQGRNVPKAALSGIQNKDKTTFSTVLKHAGVKNKAVAGIGGFVLDVGLDPTTYLTGGTGSVASKAAVKAGEKAAKKATKAGLTKEQAARFGERAAKQAEKTADQAKGATVKLGGREVPGVRKATAAASKPARAAGRKVVPQKARDATRSVAADVNPDVAPAGVSKRTSQKASQATRTARSKTNRGLHEAQQQALGIKQQVGETNYSRVIDAIEAGKIGSLPPEMRAVAVRVRSQFRHANRLRKQAGIRGGEIKARPKVKVPAVVADTGASAKALAQASRAEAAAARRVDAAQAAHDVHQGRAEVLSRNVGGVKSEKAAERGRRKRKAKVAPQYAAGGHGVSQTAKELEVARQDLVSAAAARVAAHGAHEGEKTANATQRAARAAGEKTNAKREAAPKGYIPHKLTDEAVAEGERTAGGVGRKVIRPSSSKARSDNRPLAVLREESPGKYSEDLPNLYAGRKAEGATAVARAELNRRIADLGRDVRKGKDVTLEKGESVYHIVGSDLRKADAKEVAQVIDQGGRKGRYVVLHDDIVKRAIEGSQPTLQGPGIVRGLDKAQAGFKRIALATPGFHVRNLVGDTQNAYLGQGGHRIPKNMVDAGRVLKAEGRRDKSLRTLSPSKRKTVANTKPGEAHWEQNQDASLKRDPRWMRENTQKGTQLGVVKAKGSLGGAEYWALGRDGKPVGYLYVSHGRRPSRAVYVDPAHRGKGVATKLYAEARADGMKTGNRNQRTAMGKAFTKTVNGGIKTPRYGSVTYGEAAEQLGKHGAMRTGYTGRELPELAASGNAGRVKVGGPRLPRGVKQALLNREDLPRLTTAVDALKKGATWEEAAQRVADYHFDYGHLTQFERQFARRAAPFYTFSARNIPLQTKSLITKPGKYANYEKLREEAAKASGMDEESQKARDLTDQLKQAGVKLPTGWEANLTEWEARNAGVPISWRGQKFTVSMGMPLVDLNELPGAALGDQFSEYYQKGMSLTTPVVKNAIEFMENHSFFFRDELERQNAPLVAAPEWVRMLPAGLRKKMGVTENFIDKKTGKKTLGYRAKADYVVKSVPGTPQFVNKMATQGHDRVGKGPLGKTLAFVGVKATPYDPVATAVNVAYARRTEVEKRMAALRQTGVSMKAPTREYTKLNDQLKILTRIAYQGREKQGYKVLPTQGGPKKPKTSSAGRVRVPGVSGRVKLPGAGGRVKVP